jgi:two-component system, chemotaxis family, protein-glutamate methylesterase/glutaminase
VRNLERVTQDSNSKGFLYREVRYPRIGSTISTHSLFTNSPSNASPLVIPAGGSERVTLHVRNQMNASVTSDSSESLRIVVIGASAGGDDALAALLTGLPEHLNACFLVVRHLSPEGSSEYLARRLSNFTNIPCLVAVDSAPLQPNRVHLATADHHLLVDETKLWVVRGARENRWRPAIDPLFRSAAVAHKSRVIGVILSGLLDDGSSGLAAIMKCGGITVVQDPNDAAYPDMPTHALANAAVDYCRPASSIGELIGHLVRAPMPCCSEVPSEVALEAQLTNRHAGGISPLAKLGELSAQTCPDCGGPLWQIGADGSPRFRCHTGHSFSLASLLSAQAEKTEETLWTAMRMFEERRNILRTQITAGAVGFGSTGDRLKEIEVHIDRLRQILFAEPSGSPNVAQT